MSQLSTTVSVFSFAINAIKAIIFSTINFIKSTTFNTRVFQLGLAMMSAGVICILVIALGVNIIKEVTGYGSSHLDRVKRKKNGKSILAKADMESLLLALGTVVIVTTQVSGQVLTTFLTMMMSSILVWLSMLSVVGVGFLFLNFTDSIMTVVNIAYVDIWNPLMTAVTIVGASIIIGVEVVYPIITAVTKFIHTIPTRLAKVAVICLAELLPDVIRLSFNIVYSLISNLVMWVSLNPLHTEIPILNTIEYALELVSVVSTTLTDCACYVLRYIIGGITRGLRDPSLAIAATNAINLGWVLAMQVVVIPVLSVFSLIVGDSFIWPSFTRSYDLYISTLDNAGFFVQNATNILVDVWVAGGNGTLLGMINGTIAMPTDDYQYLVRSLQAQWARGAIRAANFFTPGQIIWQAAYFAQNLQFLISAGVNGNTIIWNMDWTYNEALFISDAFGSLLNTAGFCSVDSYPITAFSQLSTIVRVAVRGLRIIWDCVIGELYYSIYNLTFPGIFTDSYLKTSPVIIAYREDVVYAGVAYGCILAYIDPYFGVSFQGAAQTVLIYLWFIIAQLITRVRAIFGGASATVLDDIEVDNMEIALLLIAQIGGFFYQFEHGASEDACQTRLTLLCNLGLAITETLGVAARTITVAVDIVVQVIKFVTGSIQQNQIQTLQLPRDIACDAALTASMPQRIGANCRMALVEDIYSAGCRIGVVLGNIIPIDIPCMTGADNYCWVTEFPNVRPNTFTKCTSTFMCKVGRWIGIIPDFFFSLFNWVVSIDMTNFGKAVADQGNTFLVNIFQKVMYLVVWGFFGPACPFAHVLDCIWSLLLQNGGGDGSGTPASGSICLMTAFMVVFVRDISDLIIMIIRIIVFILSLIFGVSAIGNSTDEFVKLINDFFTVFGETIKKVAMLFLTYALQSFFDLLSSICKIIGDIIDFLNNDLGFKIQSVDCSPLSDALANILAALGVTPIDSPENANYKRDVADIVQETAAENNANSQQQSRKCTSIFASPEYERAFYNGIARGFPENIREACVEDNEKPIVTSPPLQPPETLEERYAPSPNGKSASGSFGKEPTAHEIGNVKRSDRKRTSNNLNGGEFRLNMLQEIVLRHFGRGVANPDEMPGYMNKDVYWAPSSSCHFFFDQAKDKLVSQLGPSDRQAMDDCIRLKLVAVSAGAVGSIFAWVPEDLLYNFWSSIFGLVLKVGHFMLVVLQYFFDRNSPPGDLLTLSYQSKWRSLQLKIGFYNDTLLPLFNSTANVTEGTELVRQAVQNYTLIDYLHRNFPSLYITRPDEINSTFRHENSLVDPLQGFLDYTYEVAKDAAIGLGINSDKVFKFRNQTYGFFFNYTASANVSNLPYYKRPEFVEYQGKYWDYHNRTHLLLGLGPEVVRAMDSYRSTQSLYNIFSRALEFFTGWVANATQNGTSPLSGINLKRDEIPLDANGRPVEGFFTSTMTLAQTAIATPAAVVANGSVFVHSFQKGILERLESLYSSPAYEKELTPAGALIAGFLASLHKFSGANESKIVPPWCVAKAARAHNLTFAEIRQNVTIADCAYYANIGFRDAHVYNERTKELYERTASGDLILKKGKRLPPEKSFMEKYLAPMNQQAVENRQAIWRIGESMAHEVWGYTYIFLGDKGSAMDRFVEVALDAHPSFADYRSEHDVYKQVMDILPAARRNELKQRNHIKFDDHDVFDAWKNTSAGNWIFNISARISEAATVHQAIYDEKFIHTRPIWTSAMTAHRETRNRLLGLNDGQLYKELQARISSARFEMNMARTGRIRTNRDNDMTLYNRFTELDMVETADGFFNATLDDLADLFSKECQSGQEWLCESCFAADMLVSQFLHILNYAVKYYTTTLPLMAQQQSAIIQYYTELGNVSFSNIPPAYIGTNRTSQPRFPNLGEPIGVILQFNADETANGLDWFRWIYPILNLTLNGTIQNGTFFNYINNYDISGQIQADPTSDVFISVLRIIQFDIGIDICGYIDTAIYIVENCVPAIGTWIINHVFICNFTSAVDCSARVYSFSAGLIIIGTEAAVVVIVLGFILYFYGTIYTSVVVAILTAIGPLFLILVYDWCFFCTPILPVCLYQDVLNTWVYTPVLSGPCSILIGTYVNGSSSSYTSANCAAANSSLTFVNGAKMGFTNPLNILQFAQQAYNTTWGFADWVVPSWSFLFGSSTPTFTYSDYYTDQYRHGNYFGLFIVAVFTYGFLALFIIYVAGTFVFSFQSAAGPLLHSILIAFFALLKFVRSIQ